MPFTAFAQGNYQCIIDGDLTIGLDNDFEQDTVGNQLLSGIVIQNNSSYAFAGVNIGIGLYQDGDTVPSYFSANPVELQVSAGSRRTALIDTDLSAVAPGTYAVKYVAFQGDETSLLGALIHEGTELITITKEAVQTNAIAQSLTVNGAVVGEGSVIQLDAQENINVMLKTVNNGATPIFDTPVYVAITQGATPLGTAVRVDVADEVRLIPGGFRNTPANDLMVEGGEYTVYGFLAAESAATPVTVATVNVGERPGPSTWMYISQTAVSGIPFTAEDSVVACVDYLGAESGATQLHGPAGVAFSFAEGDTVLFAETVTNEAGEANKYFSSTPNQSLEDFTVEAVLLENRYRSAAVADEAGESSDVELSFIETQAVTAAYECSDEDCYHPPVVMQIDDNDDLGLKPYWFYIGVMLAAALLLYIMLRRLHPEDTGSPVDVSNDELQ